VWASKPRVVASRRATTRRSQPGFGGVGEGGKAAHLLRFRLGAADLEVVGALGRQGIESLVAGEPEDVVDAVLLAPFHGFRAGVVGIAADGDPGTGPVAANTPDQMPEDAADLGARGCLARAQQHRHRLAAFDMIDVDGQEAAGVVMSIEQRELLCPLHRIAGVVDVERDGLARCGKLRQKRSTSAAVMRAAWLREAMFSHRLMLGCVHRGSPLSGSRPTASLNRDRSARRRSRRRPRSRRRSPACESAASRREYAQSAPGRAGLAGTPPADRPARGAAQPRATAAGRHPRRSGRRRRLPSLSCGKRLEDRREEGYPRSWRVWRFRCLVLMPCRQRNHTRFQ